MEHFSSETKHWIKVLSFCEFNWLSHFQFFEYNRDKVKLLHNSINTNKLIMCAGNKTNKLKCNFRFSLTDLPVATGRCVTIFSRFSLTNFFHCAMGVVVPTRHPVVQVKTCKPMAMVQAPSSNNEISKTFS